MFFYLLKEMKSKTLKGKILVAACMVLILLSYFSMPSHAENGAEEKLNLYAKSAVLMDADTGRILYGKNEKEFLANASTTKILTCILALENADLNDRVEVTNSATKMPKVKLYVKVGEHYRLEDLLYSLMLESHNDSAAAIAEHVGGSLEGFSDMMNEKALEIGCENTCFLTPNGLDAYKEDTEMTHGTTAEDLAKIMAYCCFYSPKAEEFLEITRTQVYSFCNEEGRSFQCYNHNQFLQMMEGALSGKTGFTNKAGYCYVGALEKDGKRFTIALLACGWPNHKTYKWADAKELFSYGLEHFEKYNLQDIPINKAALAPMEVCEAKGEYLGQNGTVCVKIKESKVPQSVLLPKGSSVYTKYKRIKNVHAPVEEGQVLGYIYYMAEGENLYTQEIVSVSPIEKKDFSWIIFKIMKKFLL